MLWRNRRRRKMAFKNMLRPMRFVNCMNCRPASLLSKTRWQSGLLPYKVNTMRSRMGNEIEAHMSFPNPSEATRNYASWRIGPSNRRSDFDRGSRGGTEQPRDHRLRDQSTCCFEKWQTLVHLATLRTGLELRESLPIEICRVRAQRALLRRGLRTQEGSRFDRNWTT